jgi:hypothetical protein
MNHNLVNKFSLPPPSSIQQKNQNLLLIHLYGLPPPIQHIILGQTHPKAGNGVTSRPPSYWRVEAELKKQLVLMNVLIHFMIKLRGCVLLTRKIRLRFQWWNNYHYLLAKIKGYGAPGFGGYAGFKVSDVIGLSWIRCQMSHVCHLPSFWMKKIIGVFIENT